MYNNSITIHVLSIIIIFIQCQFLLSRNGRRFQEIHCNVNKTFTFRPWKLTARSSGIFLNLPYRNASIFQICLMVLFQVKFPTKGYQYVFLDNNYLIYKIRDMKLFYLTVPNPMTIYCLFLYNVSKDLYGFQHMDHKLWFCHKNKIAGGHFGFLRIRHIRMTN